MNKKMNVGILGAGNIATKMATTIREMEAVSLYGVASRDLAKAKEFANEYGAEHAFGSYTDMLSDKNIDLVYVATPHSHHYEHMKLCLEHGKNVLCEKAFTINVKQAREILSLAKEKKLLVAEAIWTRYIPMRKTLDDIIARGIVGEIQSLSANLCYSLTHIQRVWDPALAGGALLDLGVYPINFAMMVFGNPINIEGTCTKFPSGVDESASIILTFEGNKLANLFSSSNCQSNRRGLLYGTKGYIEFDNINNCEGIRVYDKDYKLIETHETPKQITGFEYEVLACKDALEKGLLECPEMPHSEIIRVMEIMDSLREKWGIKYPGE